MGLDSIVVVLCLISLVVLPDAGAVASSKRVDARLMEALKPASLRGFPAEDVDRDVSSSPESVNCALISNDITSVVEDDVALISFHHRYWNKDHRTIEAQFTFPVMPGMALTSLTAATRDGVVKAVVEDRHAAEQLYTEAKAKGDAAFMMTYEPEQSDKVQLLVGSLRPQEFVDIRIDVSVMLEYRGSGTGWELRLPLAYVRPYVSSNVDSFSLRNFLYQPRTDTVPYSWSFTANISTSTPMTKLESRTFAVDTVVVDDSRRLVTIRPHQEPSDYVSLMFDARGAMESVIRLAFHQDYPNKGVLQLRFNPDHLSDSSGLNDSRRAPTEYVIVLDRSGSMQGESITVARRAVLEWLRQLPREAFFNVVSFGSQYAFLFDHAVPATAANVLFATHQVNTFTANMGGTEILPALRAIFSRAPTRKSAADDDMHLPVHEGPGGMRAVFLVTDGAVFDTSAVIQKTQAAAHANRVFTFGIGSGACPSLVLELARVSCGQHYFLAAGETQSFLAEALGDALELAATTPYRNVEVSIPGVELEREVVDLEGTPAVGGRLSSHFWLVTVSPNDKNAICNGRIPTMLSMTSVPSMQRTSVLIPNVQCDAGTPSSHASAGMFKQAARKAILDLEERSKIGGAELTEAAKRLSVRYGVLSSATALIGVQVRAAAAQSVPAEDGRQRVPTSNPRGARFQEAPSPAAPQGISPLIFILMALLSVVVQMMVW